MDNISSPTLITCLPTSQEHIGADPLSIKWSNLAGLCEDLLDNSRGRRPNINTDLKVTASTSATSTAAYANLVRLRDSDNVINGDLIAHVFHDFNDLTLGDRVAQRR